MFSFSELSLYIKYSSSCKINTKNPVNLSTESLFQWSISQHLYSYSVIRNTATATETSLENIYYCGSVHLCVCVCVCVCQMLFVAFTTMCFLLFAPCFFFFFWSDQPPISQTGLSHMLRHARHKTIYNSETNHTKTCFPAQSGHSVKSVTGWCCFPKGAVISFFLVVFGFTVFPQSILRGGQVECTCVALFALLFLIFLEWRGEWKRSDVWLFFFLSIPRSWWFVGRVRVRGWER